MWMDGVGECAVGVASVATQGNNNTNDGPRKQSLVTGQRAASIRCGVCTCTRKQRSTSFSNITKCNFENFGNLPCIHTSSLSPTSTHTPFGTKNKLIFWLPEYRLRHGHDYVYVASCGCMCMWVWFANVYYLACLCATHPLMQQGCVCVPIGLLLTLYIFYGPGEKLTNNIT